MHSNLKRKECRKQPQQRQETEIAHKNPAENKTNCKAKKTEASTTHRNYKTMWKGDTNKQSQQPTIHK
jgi:hypothetical protein